jgi:hypothetical protein
MWHWRGADSIPLPLPHSVRHDAGMLEHSGHRRAIGFSMFFGAGFLAFVFLVGGLEPVYRFDRERAIDDIGERCPGPAGPEASFDADCAADLIRHGPLMLGVEYLAAAFGLGVLSLAGLFLGTRRSAGRVAVAALLVVYLGGWIAALEWNAREADRLMRQEVTIYGRLRDSDLRRRDGGKLPTWDRGRCGSGRLDTRPWLLSPAACEALAHITSA